MNGLIKKLIKSALAEGFVTDEIARARMQVCAGCPRQKADKCTVCGCFIELKAPMDYNKNPKKGLRVEKTHCPLGKWPGIDDTTGEPYLTDKAITNYYRKIDGLPILK